MIIDTPRLIITDLTADMAGDILRHSQDEDNRRFVPDEVFDTLEEAREQMALWVEVDDDGESQDWADYILAVPDEDVEDAVHGHADTEKFVEGKCGNEYHGSHYWEM